MSAFLAHERSQSGVCTRSLSLLIYRGEARLKELQEVAALIESDPAFSKEARPSLNHVERYVDACRKIRRFAEIVQERKAQFGRDLTLDEIYDLYLGVDENIPLDVHLSMFIPIMQLHTSPEQRSRWLEKSLRFEIIGAYAQTELAHGSNVRGIETVAVYDAESDSFDLHSPTLTSTKWWPGGLGKTCTHAVVYANLITKDRNHGPHPFMVRIRSEDKHEPLPGIEVGDIGTKLGYNSMDNGYARFNHVKVPRSDMLNGFASLTRDGVYSKRSGAEKVAYGIMLDVRCRIVANSAYVLARALTIAIRYSCVRLQGSGPPQSAPAERAVMDYPTQQKILLPLLALAFSLDFCGRAVREQYDAYLSSSHDLSLLPDLHCTTASLKALVTIKVADGMEAARKACGGHGFLQNAGFGDLLTSYLPFCTLEGTREVLGQQAGRFLVKELSRGGRGRGGAGSSSSTSSTSSSTSYLSAATATEGGKEGLPGLEGVRFSSTSDAEFESLATQLVACFQRRARALVSVAAAAVQRALPSLGQEEALVSAGIELVAASEAHAELLIVTAFHRGLAKSGNGLKEGATKTQVRNLFLLHCLSLIELNAGQFILSGAVTARQAAAASSAVGAGCRELRKHAVKLVEAWALSDTRLGSTLGKSDGNYAQALYDAAKREPLNSNNEGYERHLKFVISDRFARSKI